MNLYISPITFSISPITFSINFVRVLFSYLGLEMASELATQIEPLIHIASLSLMDVNSFLTTLTGVELNYDKLQQQELKGERKRPRSAFIPHRSLSEEPEEKSRAHSALSHRLATQRPHSSSGMSPKSHLDESSSPSPVQCGDDCDHVTGHRNSVGSIDTETFGKVRNLKNSHSTTVGPLRHFSVSDSSYTSPCTSAYDELTVPLWSGDNEAQMCISSRSPGHLIGDNTTVIPNSPTYAVSIDDTIDSVSHFS